MLTLTDKRVISKILSSINSDNDVISMKENIQHGKISTYDHCVHVVKMCYVMDKKFHLHSNLNDLLIGAMLHDFFLYDWHKRGRVERDKSGRFIGIHGFTHPILASKNAKSHFNINSNVQNIVESHMWPLTITHIPKSKEAWIVTISDKIVSIYEILFCGK